MKATELRIRNLVLYAGMYLYVSEINRHGEIRLSSLIDETCTNIENCKGIPITKEILVKSGFVTEIIHSTQWGDIEVFCTDNFYIIKREGIFYHMIDCDDREYIEWHTELPYLHTLQNLHHAVLNGKELEVNL